MKVLVVDDSILFRRLMSEVLASLPDVEVVGQAPNGKLAVQKARQLRPDLLTLDMEMPEMDGLAVLDALKETEAMPAVIVVSALTQQGGRLTMQALQKGAFDFITKPEAGSAEQSREKLRAALAPRIKALAMRLSVRGILHGASTTTPRATTSTKPPAPVDEPASKEAVAQRMARIAGLAKPTMLLIGVSTGGPNALGALLPALPGQLGLPVLVVQHMPPLFTQTLAENLDAKCALHVCEAAHGQEVVANTVYIAPGGRHMRIASDSEHRMIIQITDDPPENNCRPAVDYLFRSAANHFPGQAMAVILTGMGSDGALGLRLLKRHGCVAIAQNQASCVVYGMPKAAVDAGVADFVLPLDAIAGKITTVLRGGSL